MSLKKPTETVKVVVRCRPLSEGEIQGGHQTLVNVYPPRGVIELKNPKTLEEPPKTFTFDAVYDWNSTQVDLYNETVRPLVDCVLGGFNGTVFAYGQTGTGKTYTMEDKMIQIYNANNIAQVEYPEQIEPFETFPVPPPEKPGTNSTEPNKVPSSTRQRCILIVFALEVMILSVWLLGFSEKKLNWVSVSYVMPGVALAGWLCGSAAVSRRLLVFAVPALFVFPMIIVKMMLSTESSAVSKGTPSDFCTIFGLV